MTDKTYEAERDEAAEEFYLVNGFWPNEKVVVMISYRHGYDKATERAKAELRETRRTLVAQQEYTVKVVNERDAEIERSHNECELLKRGRDKRIAESGKSAEYFMEMYSLIDEMAEAIENECSSGCGVKMTEALAKYEAWRKTK